MERVGMIGAGAMGLALLERLKIAAVQATVYDNDSSALEAARALGCEIVSSPADVARRSTLIDIVVRTDEDVVQCMTGPDGVLAGAACGTLALLHSSILPQTVKQIEAAAQKKSVFVVDACMTGVPATVRAGELCFVDWRCGGSRCPCGTPFAQDGQAGISHGADRYWRCRQTHQEYGQWL